MRKHTGVTAPAFTATAVDGVSIDLEAFRGRPIWLAFFRYAGCPLCNLRVHQVADQGQRFNRADLVMVAVFQSPKQKLIEFAERHSSAFSIISDPALNLYRLYGIEASLKGALAPLKLTRQTIAARRAGNPVFRAWDGPPTRIPADFLIDREGSISVAHYGADYSDSISFGAVDAFLNGLALERPASTRPLKREAAAALPIVPQSVLR